MKPRALLISLFTLALLVPLLSFAPQTAALTNHIENFEDDALNSFSPTASFYVHAQTLGSGSSRVSNSVALGAKSWLWQDTGGSDTYQTKFDSTTSAAPWDLCDDGTVSWAFYLPNLPSGNIKFATIQPASGVNNAYVSITSDGTNPVIAAGALALAGNVQSNQAITLSLNTWYNASFAFAIGGSSGVNCDASAGLPSYYSFGIVGTGVDYYTQVTSTTAGAAYAPQSAFRIEGSTASGSKVYIDNLAVSGVADPPPIVVGSGATASVTGLVGMDADVHNVIVRTSGTCLGGDGNTGLGASGAGGCIRNFNPQGSGTLAERSSRNTDCNRVDGVTTSPRGTAYLICDSGQTAHPVFISLRNFADAFITHPSECDAGNYCANDIDLRASSEPGDQFCSGGTGDFPYDQSLGELADVTLIPFDYSVTSDTNPSGLATDRNARAVAVAFSTTTGVIGILEYTAIDNGDDECRHVAKIFGGGSLPAQISVWQPNPADTGLIRIVAVSNNEPTMSYVYRVGLTTNSAGTKILHGTMSDGVSLAGLGSGTSVSCALEKCLIVTNAASSNVHLINITTGRDEPTFPRTVTSEQVRGGALSGDTTKFVIVDGTTGYFGTTNNTTYAGTVTVPGGTFKAIFTDYSMTNIWAGTSTTIAWYNVHVALPDFSPITCSDPAGCGKTIKPVSTDGVLFGGAGDGLVASGLVRTPEQAKFFSAIFLTLFLGASMGFLPAMDEERRQRLRTAFSPVLCVIGIVFGFSVSWFALEWISNIQGTSMVVLSALGVGGIAYMRSR